MAALHPSFGQPPPARGMVEELAEVTIRFAGDAGDSMQQVADQFAAACCLAGNVVATLPDPPAEIRAFTGTLANMASFQVHCSAQASHRPGDVLHTLVVMNPAALRANLGDLAPGGILLANADGFTVEDLEKAGYLQNPLTDASLNAYHLVALPLNRLNQEAIARVNLSAREVDRCKNFFILGLVCWLFERSLEPTLRWIRDRYVKNPAMVEASSRALKAGYQCGATNDKLPTHYRVPKAGLPAGRYRLITGTEALVAGLLAAAQQAHVPLVFSCFPAAPAHELLHQLCELRQPNVKTIQAEDDLAALQIALGAGFGGALGVTASGSPGLALQSEALSLAVMSELPCVYINIQRAGPSAGMPTKTEQADLLHALYGRPGECPLIVLAAATPADGFTLVLEAIRLATRWMTPVLLLTDTLLSHSAETWRVPAVRELPTLTLPPPPPDANAKALLPYQRDNRLVRPWAIPGTPGQEHCLSGLEKEDQTGNVSFDPLNHEWMVQTRAKKIANVADELPLLSVDGAPAEVLVLGWGSTLGTIQAAVQRCRRKGLAVASAHLRHLHPLPKNTGAVLRSFRKVLVPELNSGQLCQVLRAAFLVDVVSCTKMQGRPFLVGEIERKIEEMFV